MNEPNCVDNMEHEWVTVGLNHDDNKYKDMCMYCGCGRVIDTRAGGKIATSITYSIDQYRKEVEELHEEHKSQGCLKCP